MQARWRDVLAVTVLCGYGYVLFEWLFLLTQRGFMASYGVMGKAGSLLLPPLVLLAAVLPAACILRLLELALARLRPLATLRAQPWLSSLPAALLLASLVLLLIDNFTYTIFRWGIISATGSLRFLYAVLLVLILFVIERRLVAALQSEHAHARGRVIAAVGLLACSLLLAGWRWLATPTPSPLATATPGRHLPNVIILATDGVEAKRMSVYGYPRKTTPFLESLKPQTMFFENAFANAGRTTSSLTSMFASRLPTETKCIFPPHILTGTDCFEHLPGLLRALGYTNYEFTIRYYADALDLNMRGAFDVANGRAIRDGGDGRFARAFVLDRFTLERMFDRISERLLFIFGLHEMVNYFKLVQLPMSIYGALSDAARIGQAIAAIDTAPRPFFIHIHLIETHALDFGLRQRVFGSRAAPTVLDIQDDALLAADRHFRRLVTYLERKKLLDDTLLVITSDHTSRWDTRERIPLMIRFPDADHRGAYTSNAQLLDLAPTILEELAVPKPEWMHGRSFFAPERSATEPILSVAEILPERVKVDWERISRLRDPGPPLWGVVSTGAVACDRWFRYTLATGAVESGPVEGHTAPCDPTTMPTPADIALLMARHLRENGFAVPELAHGPTTTPSPRSPVACDEEALPKVEHRRRGVRSDGKPPAPSAGSASTRQCGGLTLPLSAPRLGTRDTQIQTAQAGLHGAKGRPS